MAAERLVFDMFGVVNFIIDHSLKGARIHEKNPVFLGGGARAFLLTDD